MPQYDGREVEVERVRPAYQQVADQLAGMIVEGRLAIGERLPVEVDLAESFGVSRSTIREALRVMSAQNLVVTTRGVTGGTFVVHPQPDQVAEYLEASLGLMTGSESVTLDGLLEARTILEVPAARLAAERRTEEQLEVIRVALGDSEDVEAGHRFEGNRSFHSAILDAAGNRLLSVIAEPVFGVLRNRMLRDLAPLSFWEQVAAEHHRIADAIEAGDPAAAAGEMQNHLEHLRETYLMLDRTGE